MYPVRQPTAHPIGENWRVRAFAQLLRAPPGDPEQLPMLGELMLQVRGAQAKKAGSLPHGSGLSWCSKCAVQQTTLTRQAALLVHAHVAVHAPGLARPQNRPCDTVS